MNETKHLLQSKTVWTSILQLVASLLVGFGVINADTASILTDAGPEVVAGAIGAVFALVSFYTRLVASSKLSVKGRKGSFSE